MNKIRIGIGLCVLLLFFSVVPITSANFISEENNPEDITWFTMMFARGKVANITDVIINDIECYRCTAVNVKVTFVHFSFFILYNIQHETFKDFDDFCIPKYTFRGILKEGFIFGLIQWW